MKKLILILIVGSVSIGLIAQNLPDSIYAYVDGNNVTIWDVGSYRNCCSFYEMIVIQDEYHLKWLQNDIGDACYCMCNFDLFVAIGPLEGGSYTVDVYYTEHSPEEFYVGSTTFDIGGGMQDGVLDTIGIITSYQSDCYNIVIGMEEPMEEYAEINLYPNPAEDFVNIEFSVTQEPEFAIYDLLGREIVRFEYQQSGTFKYRWNLADKYGNRVPAGLYIYSVESGNFKTSGKIQVLD